jgi:hypothetical protein
MHFINSGIWDVKVISLFRDGRGVANSYINHMGVSMNVAANEWLLKCKEMHSVLERADQSNIFKCGYESLCNDTNQVLMDIFKFIGVKYDSHPDDYRSESQHILGNSMRLRSNSEIALDEKWRRMLSEADLNMFYKIGGAMNERLGYKK